MSENPAYGQLETLEPSEYQQQNVFEDELNTFVNKSVLNAAAFFSGGDSVHARVTPLGSDFTSFLRIVFYEDIPIVAKMSFDASKPRLITEYGDKENGIDQLATKPIHDVNNEYLRHVFLHELCPDMFPIPIKFVENVAFYEYIPGKTLEQAITGKDTVSFSMLGELLREFNRKTKSIEIPPSIKERSFGKLNKLSMYKARYASIEGLEKAFKPLETNGYMSAQEVDMLLQQLILSMRRLNQSPVFDLPKDTWSHGDMKPENVLIHEETNAFYFIDNDMQLQAQVIDPARMVSRIIALGINQEMSEVYLQGICEEFLRGYYGNEAIPYSLIAEIIAIDLLVILGSYTAIDKKQLNKYPKIAQIFMGNIMRVVEYIGYLTERKHEDLDSIFGYFKKSYYES